MYQSLSLIPARGDSADDLVGGMSRLPAVYCRLSGEGLLDLLSPEETMEYETGLVRGGVCCDLSRERGDCAHVRLLAEFNEC